MKRYYLAWNSIWGKKRWFLSFLAIFFVVSALMLSTMCVGNRLGRYFQALAEQMTVDVRVELEGGQIGAAPGVAFLPAEAASKLEELPQVESANYTCTAEAFGLQKVFMSVLEEYAVGINIECDVYVVGMNRPEKAKTESGYFSIVEGRFPERKGEAMVSAILADADGVRVGDSIRLRGIHEGDEDVELEVVGLHDGQFEAQTPMWLVDCNYVLTDIESALAIQGERAYREAVYTLKSAADLDTFLEEGQKIAEEYKDVIKTSETKYGEHLEIEFFPLKRMYSALEFTAKNMQWFVWIIVATVFFFGCIVLGTVLVDYINKSRRSAGVLLALGDSREGLLVTYILQILFPAVFGLAAALAFCGLASRLLDYVKPGGSQFWEYTASVFVPPWQVLLVAAAIGAALCAFCGLAFLRMRKNVWNLLKTDMEQ